MNVEIVIDAARIRRAMRRSLIADGIPLHRAQVPIDSCRAHRTGPCPTCLTNDYPARHRAVTGWDECLPLVCAWMGHQFERGYCQVCGKRVGR